MVQIIDINVRLCRITLLRSHVTPFFSVNAKQLFIDAVHFMHETLQISQSLFLEIKQLLSCLAVFKGREKQVFVSC